jgi:hypothetical protein
MKTIEYEIVADNSHIEVASAVKSDRYAKYANGIARDREHKSMRGATQRTSLLAALKAKKGI